MNNANQNKQGIFGTLMEAFRLVSDSFIEGVRYRFDLFEIELEEVTERYLKLYMMLQVAFFSIFIAFLCLNVLLLVLFWEYRIAVAAGLFLFYLAAGLILVRQVMQNTKSAPPPFSSTISVLKQDQAALMAEDVPEAGNKIE